MAMDAHHHHLPTYLAAALFLAFALAPLAAGDPLGQRCGDSGNYTLSGTYQGNIRRLAATLPKNTSSSPTLFAKDSTGDVPDIVYALALCRGDTNASACGDCVATAFTDAQQVCPYNKDATVFYDPCLLRYSNQNFLASTAGDGRGYALILMNTQNVAAPFSVFDNAVAVLLNAITNYAADNSTKRFGTGVEGFRTFDSNNPRIYGLAQCTPDTTPADCRTCLSGIIQTGPKYFSGKQGGRILGLRCNYRYEQYSFFTSTPLLQLPEPAVGAPPPVNGTPPTTGGAQRNKTGRILAIALPVFAGVLAIVVICSCLWRSKKKTSGKSSLPVNTAALEKMARAKCMIFDFLTLQEATENFSEERKLGQGGFGIVYKGKLPDGQEIAVKKLLDSATGHGLLQLQNEVQVLVTLQHKNLVRLHGFCVHQNEMILVYEFIKNGSLDTFLFDTRTGNKLSWDQQYNIIVGIAKGIMYLHHDSRIRIIHRDLKANNILLDENADPKIADFGLARLLGDHTQTKTATVAGTYGYMAPEYAMHGSVSPKVDVFSFGVLVLEIVARKRNTSFDDCDNVKNLLSDVWNCWTKGMISQMMDQNLEGYSRTQALRCIQIGLLCAQPDPDDRPDISSVVFMLTRDNMELQAPAQPAFFFGRDSTVVSQPYEQRVYVYDRSDVTVNEVTLTDPHPR